ncbi:NAD(P)H-binding protein [Undibacterium sp. Di24W]|uniref:NAD(P)H-binding protein n=1 Tax=Undibacterium sp. Di24W TaxID=3413033 RepID=UPI003BF2DF6C
MHCIILGASGLVGHQLLLQALENPNVVRVVAPTRKALNAHPKLLNPIIDFANLPTDAEWWHADVVLCALGTTMKQAGTSERFFEIDHDYVLKAARAAKEAGVPSFIYNSSLGAASNASSFYLRVKGQIEADLADLGFAKLGIVRPSFLDGGPRPEKRPGESIAIFLAKLLAPLIPKKYRAVSTAKVAKMMWQLALESKAGRHIAESDAIYHL